MGWKEHHGRVVASVYDFIKNGPDKRAATADALRLMFEGFGVGRHDADNAVNEAWSVAVHIEEMIAKRGEKRG